MTARDFNAWVWIPKMPNSASQETWWEGGGLTPYDELAKVKLVVVEGPVNDAGDKWGAWYTVPVSPPHPDVVGLMQARIDIGLPEEEGMIVLMGTDIFAAETEQFLFTRTNPETRQGTWVLRDAFDVVIKRNNRTLMDPRVQAWQDEWFAFLANRERSDGGSTPSVPAFQFHGVLIRDLTAEAPDWALQSGTLGGGIWVSSSCTSTGSSTILNDTGVNFLTDVKVGHYARNTTLSGNPVARITAVTATQLTTEPLEQGQVWTSGDTYEVFMLEEDRYPKDYDQEEWATANFAFLKRAVESGIFAKGVYFGNFAYHDFTTEGGDHNPPFEFLDDTPFEQTDQAGEESSRIVTSTGIVYRAFDLLLPSSGGSYLETAAQFAHYFDNLRITMQRAREAGKEILVEVVTNFATPPNTYATEAFIYGTYLLEQYEGSYFSRIDQNRDNAYIHNPFGREPVWYDIILHNIAEMFANPTLAYAEAGVPSELEPGVWARLFQTLEISTGAVRAGTSPHLVVVNGTATAQVVHLPPSLTGKWKGIVDPTPRRIQLFENGYEGEVLFPV